MSPFRPLPSSLTPCVSAHPTSYPRPVRLCVSVPLWQTPCSQYFVASLASPKKSTPLQSSKSSLFFENAGVWGWASRSRLWTLGGSRRRLPDATTRHPGVGGGYSRLISASTPWCTEGFLKLSTVNCRLLTAFKINTCKSVTKQMTLSIFGINTYAKTGGGGVPTLSLQPMAQPFAWIASRHSPLVYPERCLRRATSQSKRPRLATGSLPLIGDAYAASRSGVAYRPKRYTRPLWRRRLFCFTPLKWV